MIREPSSAERSKTISAPRPSNGTVIDKNFVTATSGTGTRGTFEFTTADVDDVAALIVFETSAEDGSRMREVKIPLTQVS